MPGKWIPRDTNMEPPVPVVSVRGITLPSDAGGGDLRLRVSAPVAGSRLPVVLFSHGFGSSMDAYGPLVDHWAAHGFVVVQPTYLDARRLGLADDDPRRPGIWRQRVADARRVIDHLVTIMQQVPGLADRTNPKRLAAVGHSFGGQTTSMLLGARMTASGTGEDMSDSRLACGILLASGGKGGEDLSALGREITPYLDSTFSAMRSPTLVVAGDADKSPLTVRGPDWFYDPYYLAPGSNALLTLFGGEHMLGGISGYEVTETTDENPDRVRLIQEVTLAYLRRCLLDDGSDWEELFDRLAPGHDPGGSLIEHLRW